ncbi:MAG: hypothetical protein EXR62_02930 [Chloroflexi bacterium]|nr:hypothetical protein [Chloroflexota bacterium]
MQVAVLSIVSVAGFFGSKWSMRGPGRRVDGGGTLSEHQESGELDGRKRLVYICTGLLLIYLAWQILYVILMAMGQPLTVWDAWSSWGMKARTIFLEGHITQATYGDPSRASTLPYYPLFISLIEAWLYRWLGAPDDRWVGIIYLLFYLALGGVCYSAGRRYAGAGRLFSLSLAITVMAIPTMTGLAAFSFTDLPLAVVMTVAAVYLVAWLEQAQYPAPEVQYSAPGTLVLAALAAGWLPSIKREGMVLVALLCLAMVIVCGWKRQNLDRVGLGIGALVLATVLLSGPWWFFISTVGKVNSDFLQPNLEILPSLVGRLPIIGLMVLNILLSRDWAYIWPLVGLCAICLWFTGRLRSGPPRWGTGLILLVAYMYLGLMGLSYIFSVYTPYQAHVASSFYRLAAQVVPLPVLWLGYHRSW